MVNLKSSMALNIDINEMSTSPSVFKCPAKGAFSSCGKACFISWNDNYTTTFILFYILSLQWHVELDQIIDTIIKYVDIWIH